MRDRLHGSDVDVRRRVYTRRGALPRLCNRGLHRTVHLNLKYKLFSQRRDKKSNVVLLRCCSIVR